MPPKRIQSRSHTKKMKEKEDREEAERADRLNSRGKMDGVIYSHKRPAPESSKDEAKAGYRTRYKRNRRRSKSTRRRGKH